MSVVDVLSKTAPPTVELRMPQVEGERLDAETFRQRYEAMPPSKTAELIGGFVFMPSPMSYEYDRAEHRANLWLERYEEATPGVDLSGGAWLFLDKLVLTRPDVLLRIREDYGGQSALRDGLLRGTPELVVEVAKMTCISDWPH